MVRGIGALLAGTAGALLAGQAWAEVPAEDADRPTIIVTAPGVMAVLRSSMTGWLGW